MGTSTSPAAGRELDALERIADAGPSAQELLASASERIGRVVPSDGSFLAATDPETTLSIGAGVVNDLPADQCRPTWDYEFLVPDFLKFTDIARSGRRVADIHDATGGRPERSPRFREYSVASDFTAEVRLAFTVGEAAWGIGQLNRAGDGARFDDDEKDWLERAAAIVGRGLRRAMLAQPTASPVVRDAGVVVLDEKGGVVSVTREAAGWLDELDPALAMRDGAVPLPFHTSGLAAQMRAAHARGEPSIRARMRTLRGVWLLLHGSVLEGTDQMALVIEPAKAGDVAPLIIEAYELTKREVDVTRAIARGLGTNEIGADLHLSPHTVRDHIKAIFEKVGVSSRGELVHKMFAEHYAPPSH